MASLSREAESPGEEWFPAKMPAQVQEILLKRGDIPDPRQSRNCAQTTWVFTNDWVYATRFVTPAAVNGGPVFLRCDGLDTLATLYLNGQEVGRAANMFRRHAFEVGKLLAPVGSDEHSVDPFRFARPLSGTSSNRVPATTTIHAVKPFKHLRKSGSDFSSYLGARPHYLKMGLFRDVVLDVPGRAWLDDVWVRTELNEDFSAARLVVQPTVLRQCRRTALGVAWAGRRCGQRGLGLASPDDAGRAAAQALVAAHARHAASLHLARRVDGGRAGAGRP